MQILQLGRACEHYFGLNRKPFSLTPNTEFYVDMPCQNMAMETLCFALSSGEGFIKVTGEVGTGKTLLCRRLLNALDQDNSIVTVYIPNPAVEPKDLWHIIANELQLVTSAKDEQSLHQAIQGQLLQLASNKQQVVLIVDEAQCMPVATLEALRLISNLETESQKLLQIVLFGQPELDRMLNQPELRQLKQRITSSASLSPLSNAEMLGNYLQQRMMIAGYRGMPVFSRKAIRELWKATDGVPRLINVLAQKSLLAGYGNGSSVIDAKHVSLAISDTDSIAPAQPSVPMYWYPVVLLACTALVMF